MTEEPTIVINGNLLDDMQACTIRVALEHYAANLHHDGLGDDEHGKFMTAAYLSRINEIRKLIFQPDANERISG